MSQPSPGPWTLGTAAVAVLAGMAAVQTLERLPPLMPWLLGGLLGLLLSGLLWRRRRRAANLALILSLGALAVAWAGARAAWRLEAQLPQAWEGRDLELNAEVTALPQALQGPGDRPLWRLTLRPLGPARDAKPPSRDQVTLPAALSLWFEAEDGPVPTAGERWRLGVRLKRVHALQNPGLPDAELWLLERGIGAQGSVRWGQRLAAAPAWSLQALRQALRDRLQTAVAEPRQRAVLAGLLLGDQAALAGSDWALLRDTGVVHLFSISGLHITGFAWLAALLLAALWRSQPAWCARCPAPLAARWGGLLLALGYALLAGWGVPAQRTVALLTAVVLLQSSGRLWPWPLALLFAALPIALADPWALVQPGFWLSFVAVALLMQQGGPREGQGWQRGLRELLHTQVVTTLGLAPLAVLFFGQLSLVGVVANLAAVPAVTLLLTPLALLGVLLPVLWLIAGVGVDWLWAWLGVLASWPGAVWSLPQSPVELQLLSLLGLLLAALRLPRWLRGAGVLAVLPLFLHQAPRPVSGEFRVRIFDVGQGSAIWVQTATHDLLYDTGPRWGPDSGQDAAARVLLPSLRAAGVRRLDLLLLSHGDADHAGGAASVRAGLPVLRSQVSPDERLRAAAADRCRAGQAWRWDGVGFELLHPPDGVPPRSANAGSCVLRVQAASGRSLLLTGDIEAPEEAQLLARGASLRSGLLLLPHHGSASSSSPALLDAVAPQLAFAQSGYRSRHGHPALAVQNRLRERGVPLLTSAGCGAFDWWSELPPDPAGCWRQQRRRYWHQQPGLAGAEGLHGPPEGP